MTNAVVHAYREQGGDVHLMTSAIGGELTVIVDDDGCGLAEPARRPGLGYGLKLIAEATDGLIISERGTGGTRVQMRFRL